MQTLMLLSALFCADPVSAPDGAIVVLMNSDKLVYQATGSRISHVGLVVNVNDTPMVYEATPDRVRRVPLASYRRELSEANRGRSLPIRLFLMEPRRAFSHAERLRLRGFLDRQLGRRYSVRGYLRDDPGDGVHCAALAAMALNHCGYAELADSHRHSPGSFLISVRGRYNDPQYNALPPPVAVTKESWLARTWSMCERWRKWCAWSVVESLRFCY